MIGGSTAADVAMILIEELGIEKARKVIHRLWKVKGNKYFTDSMKMVDVLLGLDPKKLLEVSRGLKSKVIAFSNSTKARI